MRASAPLTRDLLLIGGGHAHAILLRMWGMNPLPGVRLTLVNPGPTAPYTGMLPGFVAGHYGQSDLEIDLVRLARFASARLVLDQVTGLDLSHSRAQLSARPDIAFDLVSLDIGVTSSVSPPIPGQSQLFPVKPLGAFTEAWDRFLAAVHEGEKAPRVAVVGAGLGGVELAMAMAWRLRGVAPDRSKIRVTLIESACDILPGSPPALRRSLRTSLLAQGIVIQAGATVTGLDEEGVHLSDGGVVNAALSVAAAGARPAGWLSQTGLALQSGFVRVDANLRSVSHPQVFAVGDIAHLDASPRSKAGVYAVRQGPTLHHNLKAALSGSALKRFKPQADHLKLVSLGGRSAVAEKWGVALTGEWLWRWKNRIDQRFMERLNRLPLMPAPQPIRGPQALGVRELALGQHLCGGCGSKAPASVLGPVLESLDTPRRPDVLRGTGDDAAVLRVGESSQQVLTTDHFRAFTLDPHVLGQIVAHHALGDVWAMGADPQAALANVILPDMSHDLQVRTAKEIISAFETVLRQAGADLVGGHTSLGAELTLGLTVTGLTSGRPAIGLDGGRPGDLLVLTKPIGVGVVLAAEMQGRANGNWVQAALHQMLQSNGPSSQLLRAFSLAMTDVTGFGLAGHLQSILNQSGLSASLDLDAIDWADGAIELTRAGVFSSLYPETIRLAATMRASGSTRLDPRFALLFDPQTSGGLLAAIPASRIGEMQDAAGRTGLKVPVIGVLSAAGPEGPQIAVEP